MSPTPTTNFPLPTFEDFFRALHSHEPFPWQSMLAGRLAAQGWPALIDLPTASGKTACMDIALYALALQAQVSETSAAPRRIWFVVDRRIIVDAAFDRSCQIAKKLKNAQNGPLKAVADRLRALSGDPSSPPLATARLRGGTWRDDGWARLPSQPAVICSTVDQLGSALLFRAYGHSSLAAPVWAGLAANDSLVLLDEAHCAVPFSQTLQAIIRFRAQPWSELPPLAPFHAVTMSATPAAAATCAADQIFPSESERAAALDCEELHRRTRAAKSAKLVPPVKGGRAALAKKLADSAVELVRVGHKRTAVMVNRVATALAVAAAARRALADAADVILLTGRMRPLDRDDVMVTWEPLLRAGNNSAPERPILVVATQCLEVGADFSFDALVTECASLDALRQRFGRLNRLGNESNCAAAVLIDGEDEKGKTPDPIYGEALAATWNWLKEAGGASDEIDFGITAMDASLTALRAANPESAEKLYAPPDRAPVLLPAHLDLLSQTGPRPAVEPEPAFFLHGTRQTEPEAHVVWRAGLPKETEPNAQAQWAETLALVPPSSLEALSVPLRRLRAWLAGEADTGADGDVEGEPLGPEDNAQPAKRIFGLRRAGAKPKFLLTSDPAQIRPGDTVILPAAGGIPPELGQSPQQPSGLGPEGLDLAERATLSARGRVILRLQRELLGQELCSRPAISALLDLVESDDAEPSRDEIAGALRAAADEPDPAGGDGPPTPMPGWLRTQLDELARGLARIDALPAGGFLLTAKKRVRPTSAEEDDPDPEAGSSDATDAVSLRAHTAAVRRWAQAHADKCLTPNLAAAIASAAEHHDLGKLDRRFQLVLHGGGPTGEEPLAKSARNLKRYRRRRQLAPEDTLPGGFRHEMLSLAAAESLETNLPPEQSDLALHLIASHHGHARSFAPVVLDPAPEQGEFAEALSRYFSAAAPPSLNASLAHRLDSGVADRFWRLTRRHGWWGLVYLESILRLADWQASSEPDTNDTPAAPKPSLATRAPARRGAPHNEIELPAIDGANPLGFLAALGAAATLHQIDPSLHISWKSASHWYPVIQAEAIKKDAFAEQLAVLLEAAPPDPNAAELRDQAAEQMRRAKKALADRSKEIRSRKIGRADQSAARQTELPPLEAALLLRRKEFLAALRRTASSPELVIGKTLDCRPDEYTDHLTVILEAATSGARRAIDLFAHFLIDGTPEKSGKLPSTPFCFTSGSGGQYFLETVGQLALQVSEERLRKALFGTWVRRDPGLSLRWDPVEDKRYALTDREPSDVGASTEWMANLLAYQALAFFPSAPTRSGPATTGWTDRSASAAFTWPLWQDALAPDCVRALVQSHELGQKNPDTKPLRARGATAIFRSHRIQIGSPPNYKLNFAPARQL